MEKAFKSDSNKPRLDLISPDLIFALGSVLMYGASKYEERNWEKGLSWGRVFAALMRHLWYWWRGEDKDPETGFSHLWHAAANLMFLIHYEENNLGKDNRNVKRDT